MKTLQVLAVFLGLLASSSSQTDCDDIMTTRSMWGARPPRSLPPPPTQPATLYMIHHTEGSNCSTREECSARVRNLQNYAMDGKFWTDIDYSFLVGGDGFIYEGRAWSEHGTLGNWRYVGLAFIGNYMTVRPSAAMLSAARIFMDCGVASGKMNSSFGIKTHRQVDGSDCPGDTLFNEMRTWPEYAP